MTPVAVDPGRNTFLRGFGIVMLWHLIQIPLVPFTVALSLFAICVTQLPYVIPLAWKAYRRHERSRLQGILTAAGVTFLLNGVCDAVVSSSGLFK